MTENIILMVEGAFQLVSDVVLYGGSTAVSFAGLYLLYRGGRKLIKL